MPDNSLPAPISGVPSSEMADEELFALETYETDDLPPSLATMLDPHNPLTDPYLQAQEKLHKRIRAEMGLMSRRHVRVCELAAQGRKIRDIAQLVGYAPASVSLILKRPQSRTLLTLLSMYRAGTEGPSAAQRAAMLWRIAARNEETVPHLSVQALKELNSMDSTLNPSNAPQATGVTININPELMPKTILDVN